ncbi:MAG: TolC family protein [Isosphaeraceae bacterium]|nr:TolC family protein [Isosphaeraceae bacterium]
MDPQRVDRERTAAAAPGDVKVHPASGEVPEWARSEVSPSAPAPLPAPSLAPPTAPEPSSLVTSGSDDPDQAGRPVSLQEAIDLAFRRQPRLRAHLESIDQARGLKGVAQSLFLPTLGTAYSVGGYNLNVGGDSFRLPSAGQASIPGFTVVPPGFALPVGLNLSTGYELAELKLQWLVIDFGRRLGTYEAAQLGVDIAQLQTDRAYQTVANEVAVAYYNVLRTRALRRTAREATRRSEDQRDVARKLAGGGVLEREQVLRAEVLLAESLRLLDMAEEAVGVAEAALNLAIGLKPGEMIGVAEPPEVPEFRPALCDCLETAIRGRREFQVARRTVEVAQAGNRVATASFAPKVVAEGTLLDLQQAAPRGHADIALGFIRMEWTMFEGGRRVASKRIADSKVREAMAQAESIADTIAFQVNENYRRLMTARLGIDRARPAVEQARENYRLVRARAVEGDATPTEITDAQTALTRSEQNHLNSIYDYLSAIARLEYVMGVSPSPFSQESHGH